MVKSTRAVSAAESGTAKVSTSGRMGNHIQENGRPTAATDEGRTPGPTGARPPGIGRRDISTARSTSCGPTVPPSTAPARWARRMVEAFTRTQMAESTAEHLRMERRLASRHSHVPTAPSTVASSRMERSAGTAYSCGRRGRMMASGRTTSRMDKDESFGRMAQRIRVVSPWGSTTDSACTCGRAARSSSADGRTASRTGTVSTPGPAAKSTTGSTKGASSMATAACNLPMGRSTAAHG
mmetsp:Transcript_1283/g.3120  ORF Transcript_1283/g.3120 Transcript_1283/m.3120 type:complete len:239 (+) Transcript_1283:220-936(+)